MITRYKKIAHNTYKGKKLIPGNEIQIRDSLKELELFHKDNTIDSIKIYIEYKTNFGDKYRTLFTLSVFKKDQLNKEDEEYIQYHFGRNKKMMDNYILGKIWLCEIQTSSTISIKGIDVLRNIRLGVLSAFFGYKKEDSERLNNV